MKPTEQATKPPSQELKLKKTNPVIPIVCSFIMKYGLFYQKNEKKSIKNLVFGKNEVFYYFEVKPYSFAVK